MLLRVPAPGLRPLTVLRAECVANRLAVSAQTHRRLTRLHFQQSADALAEVSPASPCTGLISPRRSRTMTAAIFEWAAARPQARRSATEPRCSILCAPLCFSSSLHRRSAVAPAARLRYEVPTGHRHLPPQKRGRHGALSIQPAHVPQRMGGERMRMARASIVPRPTRSIAPSTGRRRCSHFQHDTKRSVNVARGSTCCPKMTWPGQDHRALEPYDRTRKR